MSPEEIQAKFGYTPEQSRSLAEQSGWTPPVIQMPEQVIGPNGLKPQPIQMPEQEFGPEGLRPQTVQMPEQVISAPDPRAADIESTDAFTASRAGAQAARQGQIANGPRDELTAREQWLLKHPEARMADEPEPRLQVGSGRNPVDFQRDPSFAAPEQPSETSEPVARRGAAGVGGGMSREGAATIAKDMTGMSAVTPETKSKRDNAEWRYKNALEQQAQAHQNAYAETSGALQGAADATMQLRDRMTAQDLRQRDAEDAYRTSIQAAQEDLARSHDFNTDDAFVVRGTGGKILRGIALAAGAFVAGYSGTGKNYAAEVINDAVSHEMQQQKIAYDKKRDRIAGLQTVYGQLRQRGLDDKTAMLTGHKLLLDSAQQRIGALQAKLGGEDAKQNAAKAIADLDAQKAALDEQREQAIGAAAWRIQQAANAPQPSANRIKVESEKLVPLGGDLAMVATRKEDAADLTKKFALRASISANLKEMADLVDKASAADKANPHSYYSRRMEQLTADTNTKNNVKEGQGAMSEGDRVNTERAIGVASKLNVLTGAQARLFRDAAGTISKGVEREAAQQGGLIVRRTVGRNKKGDLEEQYELHGDRYSGPREATPLNPIRGQ